MDHARPWVIPCNLVNVLLLVHFEILNQQTGIFQGFPRNCPIATKGDKSHPKVDTLEWRQFARFLPHPRICYMRAIGETDEWDHGLRTLPQVEHMLILKKSYFLNICAQPCKKCNTTT